MVTICQQLKIKVADGKLYNTDVADTGKPVVTSQSAVDFARLISNVTGGSDV